MKKVSLKVLTLVAVLVTSGMAIAQNGDNEITLNRIAGYRNWTRVNREPVQVTAAMQISLSTVDLSTAPAV